MIRVALCAARFFYLSAFATTSKKIVGDNPIFHLSSDEVSAILKDSMHRRLII